MFDVCCLLCGVWCSLPVVRCVVFVDGWLLVAGCCVLWYRALCVACCLLTIVRCA